MTDAPSRTFKHVFCHYKFLGIQTFSKSLQFTQQYSVSEGKSGGDHLSRREFDTESLKPDSESCEVIQLLSYLEILSTFSCSKL